jgi:hypothetical protein
VSWQKLNKCRLNDFKNDLKPEDQRFSGNHRFYLNILVPYKNSLNLIICKQSALDFRQMNHIQLKYWKKDIIVAAKTNKQKNKNLLP